MPYFIAEIGSNFRHRFSDSDLDVAKIQITQAKKAGASAAKFQLFTNEELYGYKMPGKLCWGLPRGWVKPLAEHAFNEGIDFMCSAFSADGIEFLNPYVKAHKIASCEALDPEIVGAAIESAKRVFISDGCTKDIPKGRNIVRMTCVAKYPADITDYEQPPIGSELALSDHTLDNALAVMYACLGCNVFEKHFNGCDFVSATPDSPHSVDVAKMKAYIAAVSWALADDSKKFIDPDMVGTHARRLIATEHILAGQSLQWGINYGSFRATKPTRSLPSNQAAALNGKVCLVDKRPGDGFTRSDF